MRLRGLLTTALWILAASTQRTLPATVTGDWGGGPLLAMNGDCISPDQRRAVEQEILRNTARFKPANNVEPTTEPTYYPFQPIAGTVWQDRFIYNFVDQDSTAGILDWDCTDFTYDGHHGHDIILRFFGEQDIGVPIFAALDGTVVALHDGEFDRNTTSDPSRTGNYVILDHGLGHDTWYWHMRKNSVAVTLNQVVKAGTQLGLAASSGNSTGPHLHFESQLSSVVYEPYAGTCQSNTPSRWITQTPIRRDTYLSLFAMHGTNNVSPFLPENPPRTGTIVRTGANQPIGCWFTVHNQPANSTRRFRYLRPNGTAFIDSGNVNFNNATPYRATSWWFYYTFTPDTTGLWTLEVSIDSQVLVSAPFTILNSGGVPTNHPPIAVTAAFDPPAPNTNDVIFCRLNFTLLEDPDYDLVRYRYQWKVNGAIVRDTTNAAFSDAIPRSVANTGDLLSCTVTPSDGITNGQPTTISTFVGGFVPTRLNIAAVGGNSFRVSWPTSGPPYVLEFNTNLAVTNWQTLSNGISQSGGQNVLTNAGSGATRFFRLRLTP